VWNTRAAKLQAKQSGGQPTGGKRQSWVKRFLTSGASQTASALDGKEEVDPTPQQNAMGPVSVVSEETMNEWKAQFSLFDEDGGGSISVTELGTVLRALGAKPTEAEIEGISSRSNHVRPI